MGWNHEPRRRVCGPVTRTAVIVLAALLILPDAAASQLISFRFVAIDMMGGTVFPGAGNDVGVAFGGRFGFADVFGGFAQFGVEADWWSATHDDPAYELRDIIGGVALWKDLLGSGPLVPYVGLSGAVHSLDTSPVGQLTDPLPTEARQIAGSRLGASAFAGVSLALSRTGAMWLVVEYRYTRISDVPHQEVRAGFRLAARRRARSVATFP